MIRRVVLTSFSLLALTAAVLVLRAGEPGPSRPMSDDKGTAIKDKLTLEEQILGRRFSEFEQSLLKLKQRLERSPRQEDRDRAVILQKALDKAKDASVGIQFEQVVDFLKGQKLSNVSDIKSAMERSNKLADDLREILALLREDTRSAKLREERLSLEKLVKEVEKLIREEKTVRAQLENGKTDNVELGKNQNRVTQETANLLKKIGPNKDGQGGEARDTKGEAKDAGKGDGKKGESKDAGKSGEAKTGNAKEAGKTDGKQGEAKGGAGDKKTQGKEGKTGEAKDAGKSGEGKQGEPKSGQGKQAEAKSGKGGEAKAGEPKAAGDKQGQGKQAEAKTSDKSGDPKQAAAKSGGKQGEPKNSKGGEAKAGESKSAGKASEGKQGEAKSGDSKSGQGQAKSGQSQSGDQQANKDNNPQSPQAGPQQPQDDTANARKRIQDAKDNMREAEKNIAKNDKNTARKDQDDAVQNLEQAKKRLEDLLRQIREEELERLLSALQARCERMLAMQIRVLDGTVNVAKAIDTNADKQANRNNQQDSLKLSDDEKEIVQEATKALEMLEAEGSAVAFPEVFTQVREDMKHVQRRLGAVDTGKVTQAIEEDIIATLKEMIDALKKARQDLDNKKSPPPSAGGPPPNQDQKLLDQIAELKMIRSMQIRVNTRTQLYGRQYEGEQTAEPNLRRELHNLSERQERIFEVTNRIAKGDNK